MTPEEVIRSVLTSGRREVQLHGQGLEHEIAGALRAAGMLASLPPAPPPRAEDQPLGTDAEAVCLAHRKRVRWMAAPGWWYHADGWPRSGSCVAMYDDNAPLVFMHGGKPRIMPPGRDRQADVRYALRTVRRREEA